MNTPNPLVPQGSLQEQSKRKSHVRVIFFSIIAVHVVGLSALLINGCKRDETTLPPSNTGTSPAIQSTVTEPSNNLAGGGGLTVPSNNYYAPPATSNYAGPGNVTPIPGSPGSVVPPIPTSNTTVDTTTTVNPTTNPGEHTIAKGDTFADLAKKYGVSVNAIKDANPNVNPSKLKIGQKIVIPAKPPGGVKEATKKTESSTTTDTAPADGSSSYVVKKGDNLTKIAKDHGVTPKALRSANNLKTDQIHVGQKLKIPAKTVKAKTEPTTTAPVATPPPVTTPGSPVPN